MGGSLRSRPVNLGVDAVACVPLCSFGETPGVDAGGRAACGTMTPMETIKRHDTGAAVEDVQQRLATIGLLDQAAIDGAFGEQTAAAVRAFCIQAGLPAGEDVTGKVWSALVDASYFLGDRTLYLRMPHFHGHDVEELQQALGALGFARLFPVPKRKNWWRGCWRKSLRLPVFSTLAPEVGVLPSLCPKQLLPLPATL